MNRLTTTGLAALTVMLIALLAGPALAQSPTHDHVETHELPGHEVDDDTAFDELVRGIDVLASREAMEQRIPDVMERLIDKAQNTEATVYERWRATSLLGNFVEPEAEEALRQLSADSEERIRAMAYYVLGAAFLTDGDDRLFAHLEAGLDDESHRVRADVVRSLGWTDHSEAPQLLESIAAGHDDERLETIAERALERLQ